jgi:hypothetical protein
VGRVAVAYTVTHRAGNAADSCAAFGLRVFYGFFIGVLEDEAVRVVGAPQLERFFAGGNDRCTASEVRVGSGSAAMTYSPGPAPRTVRAADGQVLDVPAGWELLPPGDAALTRRVKAAGDHWAVAEKKGRKVFSRGIWAPTATIDRIREELEGERAEPAYRRSREADARRRAATQTAYVEEFTQAVVEFLAFAPPHADLAQRLARRVAEHATPVGSGTVARTKRIPVERRAEAAVIAWLRHQTTGYDSMRIPRVKGGRREVRRLLATRSREMLAGYRRGEPATVGCPLWRAMAHEREREAAADDRSDEGGLTHDR